jgi:hypothetical protein
VSNWACVGRRLVPDVDVRDWIGVGEDPSIARYLDRHFH